MAPLFVFDRVFDTRVTIADRTLPIHVKRLDRGELDALEASWASLMENPRGTAPDPMCAACAERIVDPVARLAANEERLRLWNEEIQGKRLALFEQVIRDYITIDAGLIEDCGQPVTRAPSS